MRRPAFLSDAFFAFGSTGAKGSEGSFGADAPRPLITGAYRLGDVRHVIGATETARVALGFVATQEFEAGVRDFARAPLRARV